MDRFIVDFFCSSAELVIEIDGSQHFFDDGIAYDEERTALLESYNLSVIRFSNKDVDERFAAVCEKIDLEVKKRLKRKTHPIAFPFGEGGICEANDG